MAVRIGANPIGWSNDDMRELGGATPLETCLAEAKAAGFAGMELGHKFPREADALAKVLARFGLDLVSGWYSASLLQRMAEAEMQALRPHLELVKALGCRILVFAETSNAIHADIHQPLAARPVMPDHAWDVRREVMARVQTERMSFLDAVIAGVFTVPGDGCVDYASVFRELAGYSGWVVVEAEQDPAKAHPLTYARLGYRNLRARLADAGLL